MTASTTTQTPEVELLKLVPKRMGSTFNYYPEVWVCGMRLDLVATDDNDLHSFSGKMQLDATVIEQARKAQGVSDFSWVVVPKPSRITAAHQVHLADLNSRGIGLLYQLSSGKSWMELNADRVRDPNTAELRRAIRGLPTTENTPVRAGATREHNTPENAWLRVVEAAAPFNVQLLDRLCPDCPAKGSSRTFLRNSKDRTSVRILNGQVINTK